MKKLLLACSIILALSFGCEEEVTPTLKDLPSNFIPLPPLGPDEEEIVSFKAPRVGQLSTYLAFTATKGRDGNSLSHFAYTGDTLWVEIVGRTNHLFDLELRSSNKSEVDRYLLIRQDTSVFVELDQQEKGSYAFISDVQFNLEDIVEPVVAGDFENYTNSRCNSWPCFATISNYEQLEQTYANLNTFADFKDMSWNQPGLFAYYRADVGFVRWAQISAVGVHRGGWDLLQN